MDMSSLFPSDAAAAAAALGGPPAPHISFRAGILNRDATTNNVTPDPRQGTFQILTSPDDDLVHVQWRPRGGDDTPVEHDYILFTGQTEFKQVTSCPPSARIYVLKWRDGDTRLFFWMQSPDTTQDSTNSAAVNSILVNGPPTHAQADLNALDTEPEPEPELASAPAPAAPETTDRSAPSAPADEPETAADGPLSNAALAQLRSLLAAPGAGAAGSGAAPDMGALAAAQRERILTTPTPLDLLTNPKVGQALADPAVAAALPELLAEHAPPADRNPAQLTDLLRSPALRSQAAAIGAALKTEQAEGLLAQFGLSGGSAAEPFGVRRLLDALIAMQRDAEAKRPGAPPGRE